MVVDLFNYVLVLLMVNSISAIDFQLYSTDTTIPIFGSIYQGTRDCCHHMAKQAKSAHVCGNTLWHISIA